MIEIWVVGLAGSLLLTLLWRIWFDTNSPLSHIRTATRRKHWNFEEDRDGQGCRIRGQSGDFIWELEWNNRGAKPLLQLISPDQARIEGWSFIRPRTPAVVRPRGLVAQVFAGKPEEPWSVSLAQARELRTGREDFDTRFCLMGTGIGRSGEFSEGFVNALNELPPEILDGMIMIRGQGQLRIRIEGIDFPKEPWLVQKLPSLARETFQGWKMES